MMAVPASHRSGDLDAASARLTRSSTGKDKRSDRATYASARLSSAGSTLEPVEEQFVCFRYTHLSYCPCNGDCTPTGRSIVEVTPGVFVGPLQAAFATRELTELKITHIVNAACTEYSRRPQFSYLNIPVYDMEDNIAQFFRMSNNFISQALASGGKVLVHSRRGKCRAQALVLAYLVAVQKVKLKEGLAVMREQVPETEVNAAFLDQLEQYDLEKLAIYRQ